MQAGVLSKLYNVFETLIPFEVNVLDDNLNLLLDACRHVCLWRNLPTKHKPNLNLQSYVVSDR